MGRKQHYRRDSRTSTIDYSDITELSNKSLWDRSISASNEDRAMFRYRRKLERRWDDANPVKGSGSMSESWEMVNRIINRPVNGDEEALIYLKMLVEGEDAYEATHSRDVCAPSWTLMHKLAFYGCPKCVSYLVKHDADLFALDDEGNRPLDLARFGASPAHRDIAIQLMDAMRKWKASDALRKIREAKEMEEALLMEEDAGGGGHTFDGGGQGGQQQQQQHAYGAREGDDASAVTWGDTAQGGGGASSYGNESKAQRKARKEADQLMNWQQQQGQEAGGGGHLAAATAATSAEASNNNRQSLLRRGLSWISGGLTANSSSSSSSGSATKLPAIGNGSALSRSGSGGGGRGGGGGADSMSGYSAVSAALKASGENDAADGESYTTASSPYSRVDTKGSTLSTSVREGRRKTGPKVGANSRFVDPVEKVKNVERKERELEVIKEIYRTDFRRGTFNQDLLPHVKATVDGLRDFVPTLDPRMAKHIEQDEVDEDDEYAAEAAVVHGELGLRDFLEGHTEGVVHKVKPKLAVRRPTFGGGSSGSSSSSSNSSGGGGSGRADGGGSVDSSNNPSSSNEAPVSSLSSQKQLQRNRAKQVALARGVAPPSQLSISSQRRTLAAVSASRTEAAELRYREGAALLGEPGWVSGSQTMASTLLYREGRVAASQAEQAMADIPRLGGVAPLGSGSHAYRIGGRNEHSADKPLTALEALHQQRQKKWWIQKPGAGGI
jgi:hypothetical protein